METADAVQRKNNCLLYTGHTWHNSLTSDITFTFFVPSFFLQEAYFPESERENMFGLWLSTHTPLIGSEAGAVPPEVHNDLFGFRGKPK